MADDSNRTWVDLAVERGLLSPKQADAARPLPTEEVVARGLIDRRELDLLLKLAGRSSILFDRYEVLQEIGRGGMGTVYKCRDRNLDRIVALKGVSDTFGGDFDRFEREARTAARLKHPHIVPVHDFGRRGNEVYLTMDFIDGRSFESMLSAGLLDRPQILAIVQQIASALTYAHRHNVIHRDVKPDNILVDGKGHAFLADFGLAKRVAGDVQLTISGMIVGTPAYMSPEQAEGKPVDARTDVYSLGATLYRALTGELPHQGSSPMEVALKVIHDDPRRPKSLNPNIARDLETICLKAMHRDPERRYPGAEAFSDDLKRYLGGETIVARPAGAAERAVRWVRRNRLAAAFLVTVLAGGGVLAYLLVGPGRLKIASDPPGANVYVDRELVGTTPLELGPLWPPGPRSFRLVGDADHESVEAVAVALPHAQGSLTITTPLDGLTVALKDPGGKTVTQLGPGGPYTIATGRYALEVSRDGFFPRTYEATVARDAESAIHLTLTPAERWKRTFSAEVRPVFLADLNGDGVDDVGALSAKTLTIASGLTGETLMTFEGTIAAGLTTDLILATEDGVEARRLSDHSLVWRWNSPVTQILTRGTDVILVERSESAGGIIVLDATGAVRWRLSTPPVQATPGFGRINDDAVLDVIVADVLGGVTAIDGSNGRPLWSWKGAPRIRRQPVFADGRILIGADLSAFFVLDARAGTTLWQTKYESGGCSAAVADLDRDGRPEILLGAAQDRLTCLDFETREERWSVDQSPSWSCPVAADVDGDGTLEVISGSRGIAIVSHDGSRLWRYEGIRNIQTALLVADVDGDGGYEIVAGSLDGELVMIEAADRGPLWSQRTGVNVAGAHVVDLDGNGTPEVAVTGDFALHLLDARTGRRLWQAPIPGGCADPRTFFDVNGDSVLDAVVSDIDGGRVLALSGRDGSLLWELPMKRGVWEITPSLIDLDGDGRPEGVVGTGSNGGEVVAFNLRDGSVRWRTPTATRVNRPVRGLGGDVVARTLDGSVLRLSGKDGSVLWKKHLPDTGGSALLCDEFIVVGYAPVDSANATRPGALWFLDADGQVSWTFETDAAWCYDPATADLDGDGAPEVIFGTFRGSVIALSTRTRRPVWTLVTGGAIDGRIDASRDFDGDGTVDVVVGSADRGLYLISGKRGGVLARRELGVSAIRVRPFAADLDGDGRPEVIVTLSDYRTHAFRMAPTRPAALRWDQPDLRTEFEAERTEF